MARSGQRLRQERSSGKALGSMCQSLSLQAWRIRFACDSRATSHSSLAERVALRLSGHLLGLVLRLIDGLLSFATCSLRARRSKSRRSLPKDVSYEELLTMWSLLRENVEPPKPRSGNSRRRKAAEQLLIWSAEIG